MWNYVDSELKKYYKKHKTNDKELEYRIQNVFNMGFIYEDLFKYANKDILKQFKTRIRLFKEKYKQKDYVSYMVNKYQNRTLVKNNEVLRVMLMMEYAEVYMKDYEEQIKLFEKVSEAVVKVSNAEVEYKAKGIKPIKRKIKRHPFVYEHIFLLHFLAMPNNLGVTWDEHVASIIDYNSDQCYKQAVIDLRELQTKPKETLEVHVDLIDKQTKREIDYRPANKNTFTGQIDNEMAYIINEMRRQIYEYYGVKEVRIKGVLDRATCEKCEGYIGQIFKLEDIEVGEQVGSHYRCRCYIEAWSFKESKKEEKEKAGSVLTSYYKYAGKYDKNRKETGKGREQWGNPKTRNLEGITNFRNNKEDN